MILNKLLNANLYILLFTTIIFLIISRYIYLVTAFCNKWHKIINNPKYSYTSQHNANHLIYTYHISLKYWIAIKSVSYCINNTILFSAHLWTTHCLKPMGFLLHRPRFYVPLRSEQNKHPPDILLPTISTGVNLGSPCPIYFFMLFVLILLSVYFLRHWYPCHVLLRISDISMSSLTNLLYLDSDTRKQNIIDY